MNDQVQIHSSDRTHGLDMIRRACSSPLYRDNCCHVEYFVLSAHTATNGPVVAAWYSAFFAPAVSLAVASTAIRLDTALCFAAPSTAVTNAMTTAICLARAFRKAARFRTTVGLAKATSLPQTLAPGNSTSWFPTMCTTTSEPDLKVAKQASTVSKSHPHIYFAPPCRVPAFLCSPGSCR